VENNNDDATEVDIRTTLEAQPGARGCGRGERRQVHKFALAQSSGDLHRPQHSISIIIVEKPHLYLLSIQVLGRPLGKASQLIPIVKMALTTRSKRQSIA
jgi:hypothetical protein